LIAVTYPPSAVVHTSIGNAFKPRSFDLSIAGDCELERKGQKLMARKQSGAKTDEG